MDKTGFLEESPGNKSANRLIFVYGFFWLMAISTFIIILKAFYKLEVSWGDMAMVFGTISGVLTALKVGQKAIERPQNPQSWVSFDQK